jgi:predicted amidohydrolase YtcJ
VEAIRAARHRLEHAEMVDTPAMVRILLLGLTISSQPLFDELWGGPGGAYERRLGAVRAADLNPFADLVGAGVPVVLGSASPVTPVGPWAAVRAAAHHHERSQRLSMAAAFHAHTAAGHDAARRPGRGELRAGAAATFAVWRADGLVPAGARGAGGSSTGVAGAPLLPDLAEAGVWPTCLRTVRDGVVLYDETA